MTMCLEFLINMTKALCINRRYNVVIIYGMSPCLFLLCVC